MIITIMQPAYLPWLGFFDRISRSDLCIILDDVLLDNSSKTRFINRNKIRTKDGWCWLTLPMKTKGKYKKDNINEIELVQDKWRDKHWKSIQACYAKSPYFSQYSEFFQDFYSQDWINMVKSLDVMTDYFLTELKISAKILKSSELRIDGSKTDRLINLCQAVGGSEYISGPFGREYLEKERFQSAGIKLWFHDYSHPQYTQVYPGFEAYMGIIDLLFNYGEESVKILQGDNKLYTV